MGIASWIQRIRLRNQAPFRLSGEIAAAYRQLQYDANAAMAISYLPLSTIFWADEHPGGLDAKFESLDETTVSILRLVGARSYLCHY